MPIPEYTETGAAVRYHPPVGEPTTIVAALRWGDGLELLDQRLLPQRERWVAVPGAAAAVRAIRTLTVRGAGDGEIGRAHV